MKIIFDLLLLARKKQWRAPSIDIALGKNKLPGTWSEFKDKIKRT